MTSRLSEIKERVQGHELGPLHVEDWDVYETGDRRGLQIVMADNESMTAEYTAKPGKELQACDRANFELYASAPDLLALAEELERELKACKLAYGKLFTENAELMGKIDELRDK